MKLVENFINRELFTHDNLAQVDAICILGPTASGKTKFAVEVVMGLGRFEGGQFMPGAEIISADSRQVYRGMDIGTGKDIGEYTVYPGEFIKSYRDRENKWLQVGKEDGGWGESIEIPCHLINVVDAGEKYNIFEYQKDFSKAYKSIKERGMIPVICGGSGLYIEAATMGYELKEVVPNNELRARLEIKSMEDLIEMLTKIKIAKGESPHNNSDFDSKKRVIRAIEIAQAKEFNTTSELLLPQKCLYIGIDVDRETRNARIDARLRTRLQEGLIEEVQRLLNSGILSEDLIYYGLEYKFVTRYVLGELGYEEMVEKLAIAIHQFAKRQMTWFRGMERKGVDIKWIKV
ncbi:MAG: tRNA dimethylallyltransferase [Bacteroidales bacterium]